MSDVDETTERAPELYGCPVTEHFGQAVVYPPRDAYIETIKAIADDGYEMCLDVTAVDYLLHLGRPLPDAVDAERFEVVVNLLDLDGRRRLRVRVQVPESDPTLPTLFDLYPGTEASEREVFDMFGISFTGHPDPTRILMPEDWDGHPLRKDYAVGEIPVQFKGAGQR
jgi:NADH-quinone oxidoreductase subunit C